MKQKRNIVLFLASQTISLFGSSVVSYAITWYITLNTHSGVMMTISILCSFIPTFILSPIGGLWADRYDRKKLIAYSDSLIAFVTLIVALIFMAGYKSINLLFVVSAIRAVGSAFQTPAVSAFLPQIVPEDALTKVNGINNSVQSMVLLLSPMLSGALLTVTSIEKIFFVDIITALTAVVIVLFFVKSPFKSKEQVGNINYLMDIKEGILYIKNHSFIKTFFIFFAIFMFTVAPTAFLSPLQVTRSFGDDAWRLTAIEVIYSIGMILGGFLISTWGGFKNKTHSMAYSIIISGIFTFMLGVPISFSIYLISMLILGFITPTYGTPATVLLQEKVENEFLGRVFGVQSMIVSIILPVAMLMFGPLSDIIQIEWLFAMCGIMQTLIGVFMLSNRTLLIAGE